MTLKKIIFLTTLSLCFSRVLSFDLFSFSTGAGSVPKAWHSSFFNVFKRIPTLFSAYVKTKVIHTLLTREHKTGIINSRVNSLFFSLDDEIAMKIGPKIAEFRKHQNARNKMLKEIASCADMKKRTRG